MKQGDPYQLDIPRTPEGDSSLTFKLADSFFELIPGALVTSGNVDVSIQVAKSKTMLVVKIYINGTVELICDRTTRPFDFHVETSDRVVYQFADQYQELSDQLIMIPRGLEFLSLVDLLYNLIAVEVPMKKLHPDLDDQVLEQNAEGNLLIYQSATPQAPETEELPEDSPWKALLKLKNQN